MSRRRFFAPPESFRRDQTLTLASEEAQHMRGVLRLTEGDEVFVFDGLGSEFRCRIDSLRRDAATLSIKERVEPSSPESPLDLCLALALLKGEKFDLVVQKATELGVHRIVPVMTKLSDIKLRDERDSSKRAMRWRRIAVEAAKQCGRARVPTIDEPIGFEALLGNLSQDAYALRLMFVERGGQKLKGDSEQAAEHTQGLIALIGSEGGWTMEEIQAAQDAGWQTITLGGRILRAETAAIAITALLQHLFGDLR